MKYIAGVYSLGTHTPLQMTLAFYAPAIATSLLLLSPAL